VTVLSRPWPCMIAAQALAVPACYEPEEVGGRIEASGLRVPVSDNTSMRHNAKSTGMIHPRVYVARLR
jgi:hypothetical protein